MTSKLSERLSKKDLVKLFTTIPHDFVDDFYTVLDTNINVPTAFPIDLDVLVKWLGVRKYNIVSTLKESYKLGDDYIIEHPHQIGNPKRGKGGHNKQKVMLTIDTFKRLCMRSKTKKSEEVRTYFIELDNFVTMYKTDILNGLLTKLNKKRKTKDGEGFIYVFRVKDGVLKIGHTKDMLQRLRSYMVGRTDNIEILASFKTSNRKKVENCVKTFCQAKRFLARKELYEVDEDIIKRVMQLCVSIGDENVHQGKLDVRSSGNYYIFIDRGDK
jgi:phage anti-repressor protein